MLARIIFSGLVVFALSAPAVADVGAGDEEIVVPRAAPPPAPPPAPAAPPPPVEQPVTAAPPPFVEFERSSLAAGIGFQWGAGELSFEGRRYGFSVQGLSVADIGASKMAGEGHVKNLERIEDFAGTYVAVEAGAAAGIGAGAIAMRNEHGVVITVASDVRGAQLTLGPQGLRISLE